MSRYVQLSLVLLGSVLAVGLGSVGLCWVKLGSGSWVQLGSVQFWPVKFCWVRFCFGSWVQFGSVGLS